MTRGCGRGSLRLGRHGREEPARTVCVRPPAPRANRSSLETFSPSERLMDGATLACSFDGERTCLRRPASQHLSTRLADVWRRGGRSRQG